MLFRCIHSLMMLFGHTFIYIKNNILKNKAQEQV
jgi:hypothetical protein